jgi:hypothetical protein
MLRRMKVVDVSMPRLILVLMLPERTDDLDDAHFALAAAYPCPYPHP